MTRALPDNSRPARSIGVGDDIYLLDQSAWLEVTEKATVNGNFRFTLANGVAFHARPADKIRSRRIPKEPS